MTQPTLFDHALAQSAKRRGLARVTESHPRFLERAREVAVSIARERGTVTADDVRERCAELGIEPHNKNAWGAVWSDKRFECIGLERSRQEQGHGNRINRYRLRGNQ